MKILISMDMGKAPLEIICACTTDESGKPTAGAFSVFDVFDVVDSDSIYDDYARFTEGAEWTKETALAEMVVRAARWAAVNATDNRVMIKACILGNESEREEVEE